MHLDIGGKVTCKILKQENNSNPNKWTKNLSLDFWTCKEVYQNYFFVHVILTICYLTFFNGQFNFVGDPLWGVTSSTMCFFVFLVISRRHLCWTPVSVYSWCKWINFLHPSLTLTAKSATCPAEVVQEMAGQMPCHPMWNSSTMPAKSIAPFWYNGRQKYCTTQQVQQLYNFGFKASKAANFQKMKKFLSFPASWAVKCSFCSGEK